MMIALISPAKTMVAKANIKTAIKSEPRFTEQTNSIVLAMLNYSSKELSEIFKISTKVATQLRERFVSFFDSNKSPIAAVESYDGVVYKHFKDESLETLESQTYLQNHLRISSLLYGILRPYDTIRPYRMEGFVRLNGSDERVDKFWRTHQTQLLIDEANNSDSTLLYLASKEEQNSFDWKRVKQEVRIIDFQFLTYKGDKLRQVVVYTKMARGEMIKYMIKHKIENPEDLKNFEWNGYRYNDKLSNGDVWVWLLD